jgi:hypothetical protein
LKNIILEDACPLGKLEKWLIKFGSKYIELQIWKKSLMACPMMGLPIDVLYWNMDITRSTHYQLEE